MKIIATFAQAAFLTGLLTIIAGTPAYASDLEDNLASVSIRDGISREEAAIIAAAYFRLRISGCGVATLTADTTEEWNAQVFIGLAGANPIPENIRISKGKGTVRFGEDTSTSYLDLLAEEARFERKRIIIENGITRRESVLLARYYIFTSTETALREYLSDYKWRRPHVKRRGQNYTITFPTKTHLNPNTVRVVLDAKTGSLISANTVIDN